MYTGPKAEHGDTKARNKAEEACDSGSDQDYSDSDDEGTDGYKRGDDGYVHLQLHLIPHIDIQVSDISDVALPTTQLMTDDAQVVTTPSR